MNVDILPITLDIKVKYSYEIFWINKRLMDATRKEKRGRKLTVYLSLDSLTTKPINQQKKKQTKWVLMKIGVLLGY